MVFKIGNIPWSKGKQFSEEHKRKIGLASKGRYHTEETKRKMSLASKGNKNALGYKPTEECRKQHSERMRGKNNPNYGKHLTEERKKRLSLINTGKKLSIETKAKIKNKLIGRIISQETRKKMRISAKHGVNHHKWKGGITPLYRIIRNSEEYKLWRDSIYKKDNYTCRMCGKSGVKFHAHHLWEFAKFPELRFAINNGITLCLKCHFKIHKGKYNIYGK